MIETKEWILNATDRCDVSSCNAQAYVMAKGVSGELLFCSHHFNKFDGDGLRAFAFEIIDERDKLSPQKDENDF